LTHAKSFKNNLRHSVDYPWCVGIGDTAFSGLLAGTYRVGDSGVEDTFSAQASVSNSAEVPRQAEDTVQKNDEKTQKTISSDGVS